MKTKLLLVYFLIVIFSGVTINSCTPKEEKTPYPVEDLKPLPKDTLVTGLEFAPSSVVNALSVAPEAAWAGTLPVQFSLEMPPIMNQGLKGSCVAFATAYAARSYQRFVNFYNPSGTINYTSVCSPEYIYNQIKISDCSNGSYFTSYAGKTGAFDLLKNQGVCSWADMPYNFNSCSSQPNNTQINLALQNKISNFQRVTDFSQTNLKNLILNKYPIVIGAIPDEGFMRANSSFIWSRSTGAERGGHAMVLCGWDDSKNAYKIMNSWGTSWGDRGFSWLDYNYARSAIKQAFVMTPVNVSATNTRIISLSEDLNFGSVSIGSSTTRILTIVNQGNSALTISSLSLPAGFFGSYSGTIPANSSTNVSLTFRPVIAQSYNGEVVVTANQTSGNTRIQLSGIGISGSTAYSGSQIATNKVIFGGTPFCSYESWFSNISMSATVVNTVNSNAVSAASLQARYTETPLNNCPYPAIASNIQVFKYLGYRTVNGQIEISFETQQGAPSNMAIFIGNINNNRLEGKLTFSRNDPSAQASALFRKSVICSLNLVK